MEKIDKLSEDTLLSEEEELFALLLAEEGFATQQTPTLRAREQIDHLPLSFAQERLWFLDQLQPGHAIYNIFVALRLTGHLNVAAFEQSLHTIIQRHEALRTTFIAIEGQPEQVIVPHLRVALPVLDISNLPHTEQESTRETLLLTESYRPFNLQHGPLLRAMLVRLHTDEHIFLLTMHHIISDGWSLGVFNRELVALYEAFSQGQPSPLPALPIQYADFALWQRQRLQGDMLQKQLQYWREQLTGAPALLPLPTERPRPTVQTFGGAVHNVVLSADLTAAARTFSQSEGVTFFTTLLATFQTLLSRYSEQDDVSVGTYIAGRTHLETEQLIGFFINNLVLRTNLSGNPSFRTLLQRASQVAQDAYAHQDVPFEHLIQELQPERNPGYTPFFQVMLIHQNMPWYAPNLSGLNFQTMNVDSTRSNFDLSLWVVEGSANLYLTFEYNTDLFDAATINRMADHFQNLLHAVVADPSQRISALPLLSEGEQRHLLQDWNASEAVFDSHASLNALLAEQVTRTPDTVAIVFEDQHLTYDELDRRAAQLAVHLQSQGVGPDILVGLCLERSFDLFIGIIGILMAGAAYVPLDPTYPRERLAFIFHETQMPVLLSHSSLLHRLPAVQTIVVCLDTDWPIIAAGNRHLSHTGASQNLAYVIYTSGSTGQPKGVAISHHSLLNFTQAAVRLYDIQPGDRVLQFASPIFDASAEEIYPCLAGGATLVLRNETMLGSPDRFLSICEQWGLTVLDLPTAYWHELAAADHYSIALPPYLRLLIIGGEQASSDHAASWQRYASRQVTLLNTYGPTETTIVATAHQIENNLRYEEAAIIGRPLPNVQAYVLDSSFQPVPFGVPGELFLGGAGLARGYLNRPTLTAERFLPDPFSHTPGARLYRTGDRVRRLPTGELQFLGRLDSQVKIRGFRIETGEIEAVLYRHPAVREAIVLAREDTPGDKRLVAYVVLDPAQPDSTTDLRTFLQQHLPGYMQPAAFVPIDTLPLTPQGKVDRHALPAPDQQGFTHTDLWEAPRTPAEELLADLWSQLLHIEHLSRHDHFFEIGGHSLLATRLVARVRNLFNVELPLRIIFESPTIAGLAREIETARRSEQSFLVPPLAPRLPGTAAPLSYAQQRLWFLDQLQPGSSSYNIDVALHLSGHLEQSALQHSINLIVQRHESLRTTFVAREGHPLQIIAPTLLLDQPVIDLSALGEECEAELDVLAWQEAQQPFDLAVGPLIRATLVRLDTKQHVLLLTLHHIITDAWSMGVLYQELATLYRAEVQGQVVSLPALPVQYADFAIWQRQWLEEATEEAASPLEQQLTYWRGQLEGVPPLLELPTDHPRPQIQTFRGAHTVFSLSLPLVASLRRLSQQEGVTLFMTMLAAFEVLLSRYSGHEDIVVGTPIANRRRSEVEDIIGFFVNSLAMRLKLVDQPSVREVLRRMRESALAAYAHQDLPFERLVDALHPQRVMSHPPIFQVMFDLQHVASTPLKLSGLQAAFLPVETGIARFDLTLTIHESEQGLLGVFEYNLDLFDPPTIQRMAGHFQTLLEGMVAHPEARFASLPLLTGAEYQQLLLDWNATGTTYPQHRCLPALFEEQVERSPDAIALVFEEQQLTYYELNRRANQLAHHLQHLGVKTETLVGLCLERSLEMLVGLLGVLKAGAAYLPLDPASPRERLAFMLADSQVAVLLSQSRFSDILMEQHIPIIYLDTDWHAMRSEPVSNPGNTASPDTLAYVIYTSGSTGQPKGVPVSHAQVARLFAATDSFFHFDERDHWTLFHSYAFDFSVWEMWGALLYGGRLVIVPYWQSRSPRDFSALLRSQRITVLNQTPSAFRQLIGTEGSTRTEVDLRLRLVIFGGEALDPHSLQPWFERHGDQVPQLVNMYGITETTVHVTSYLLHESDLYGEVQSPIGRPLSDLQVYILDARMQPVPVGVIGEMYVGGAGLSRGYLHRPELTAGRFVPDPFSQQMGARLYKTGDLARYLPDGQLVYLGRNDAQVKIRGFRIELGEIEAALIQHQAVSEAVVVAHEEPSGDKRLVAYLVPEREQEIPATADLRHFLARQLLDYMVPALFVFLEALPLTSNGKLDRRALPAPESSRSALDEAYAAPRTPAEELLAGIWSTVLNLAQVGIHDNFFELGGDSIMSIQVVARANAAGFPLTPRLLFQHQTIAQLANASGITPTAQVEQGPVSGSAPLTPIQHWFFERDLPAPHHWNQAILLAVRQPLVPALLTQALQALLLHHDALRLRAEHTLDGWHLFHADPDERIAFTEVDLTALSEEEQASALSSALAHLQASLNLADGPIMRAVFFDLGLQQPARLFLFINHLAIDIVSWPILLADIQIAYQHLSQGQPMRLPPKTTPFQRWAQHLVEYAQTPALRQQADFWLGQPWAEVRPLPADTPAGREANIEASAQTVIVALSAEETQALLSDVPGAYHTHINEVLLTALVQTLARWTGQTSLLLHLEGHGREDLFDDVDLTRTVGWFTTLTPLVLSLPEISGTGEALKHIKELLRRVPQNGFGYGLLRYLSEDAAITEQLAALPQPEISFNYGGRSALSEEEGLFAPAPEPVGATHSLTGQRPHVLEIYGRILEGQLYLGWTYSENLHRRKTIESLAQSYLDALRTLIAHCQSPAAGGYTPSDFPEAALSQAALDTLVASLTPVIGRGEGPAKPDLEAIYPLSPMQEGMLFHYLYAPRLEVYFEQFAYTLQGKLDVPAFKAAWQSVAAHHASLRTSFVWEHLDSPLQVVHRQVQLPWVELDWRELPASEQQERLQTCLQDDRAQGFDLSHAPLLRLSLIRLRDQVTHFTWSFHHLILDGWSVFTILGQVFACYEAYRQGKTFHLPPARLYRDYIAWLRQQNMAQAETFWRETLRGFTASTPLGIDRPHRRKTEPASDYHSHQVRLSKASTTALQTLARQQQLTLNTVIQGAWALLLSYYSGQNDVVFGTTVSGRPAALAGVEEMVGLFINTLPVRIQVESPQQLLPWLQALQAQQAEARQYEYSPLVQVQGWSEMPRGQSLFESLLIFANYPVDVSFVQESSLEIVNAQVVERTNYPLTMSVTPLASLLVSVTYAGTHFAHESILRMLGHLQTLLEGMVANPRQMLSDLPFLTGSERQQLLLDWNATGTSYLRDVCLHTLFEQQVERTPEAIALVMATESSFSIEQQLTYGELNARANQLAHYLQRLGVGPETCVGLCMERSAEMIIALLAILKAGGAYVPLDPAYPAERLSLMLQETQANALEAGKSPVLLTLQSLLPSLPQHAAHVICLDSDWSLLAQEDRCNSQNEATTASLAYVIYTSGSTGRPKGTLVPHHGLSNLVTAQVRAFAIEPSSRVLQFASMSFDAAVSELFTTLLAGATLVLEPKEMLYPGPGLVQQMEEQAISVVTLPPSVLAVLPAAPLPALRTLVVAGEACPAAIAARWAAGRRFLNAYGPTEASVCATIATCEDGDRTPPIGRPIDNVRVYILDAHLRPVPVGVTGELYIASPGLARGYLHLPALTAERFVPDPFGQKAGSRLYCTGDLVRYLPDGQIEYLGRRDGQVKVRGYRIEVGEIEAIINSHPAIREAVVLAHTDESSITSPDNQEQMVEDKRLVAYLVAQTGSAPSSAELREYLLHYLPEYMIPAVYMQLDALPHLPNGKLDRRALPAPGEARPAMGKVYVAPGTPLEQYLAVTWQELLKLEAVGIHDNFFELGGDSIKAAISMNRVQERLGILVYVVALFDAPTIAGLAHFLAEQYTDVVVRLFGAESLPSSVSPAVPLRRGHEPLVDDEKVRLLRQVIVPLAPYPPQQKPRTTKNPPAVFVLSPPRSGSTLLRVMLAGHPSLFAPPELELLSFQTLGERHAAFAGRNAFWLEGLLRALMELKACDAETAQQLMAGYEAQDLPTWQFYRLLQEWLGDRLLVDKTPAYALDLAILQRAEQEFEETRYIHLVRHPRAMIHSFEEARLDQVFFRHPHSFSRRELAELIWVVCQQNIQEFLRSVPAGRQHQVSFEELVRAPQQVMESICHFLGVEYHPAMIEPYQGKRMTDGIHPLSKMIGDIKFHEHQAIDATAAERWKAQSDEYEPGEITREIAATLDYTEFSDKQTGEASVQALSSLTARTTRAGNLPLSFAQERLWFLDQWVSHPEDEQRSQQSAYNIYSNLHMEGRLHIRTLERSLNEIVRRHEVLRTTFVATDGYPAQVIAPSLQIPLPVVDLHGLPQDEQERIVEILAAQEVEQPFDLSMGPLLRTTLVRLHKEEHIFLLTIHHIVADGWSIGVFNQELAALYEAFTQGQPSPLAPLPTQYADFALWQRQRLQGTVLQEQMQYWRQQLQGAPALLPLPTDRPRPAVQTFAGAAHSIVLPADLTNSLKALSQTTGVTLFTTLLAAFQTLLWRWTQQDDISVGTYIAGRTGFETERLIGFFINDLVLRTDLSGDPPFRTLLKRAGQVTHGAYAHQDVPFEHLIQELQPERNPSHTPFFQVMLIYQNMPRHDLTFSGLTMHIMGLEVTRANFDLSLWVVEESAKLYLTFEYNTDLFEATTIQQMAHHLRNLLDAIVLNPDQRLSTLPLLSRSDYHHLLLEQNANRTPFANHASIDGLLSAQHIRTPDAIALVFDDHHLTYDALHQRAERLARLLQHLGVAPETPVGLCLERSLDLLIGMLAILKAGGAYVPLDPGHPEERLAFIMDETHMPILLTHSSLVDRLPQASTIAICLDTIWFTLADADYPPLAHVSSSQNLAYVIYTSGSTGQPKGVAIPQRSLVHFTQAATRLYNIQPGDRVLQFASASFDTSAEEIYPCLTGGATLVLRNETMLSSAAHFFSTCQQWGLTILDLPTAYWHELAADLDHPAVSLPTCLRLLIIGGEQALSERLSSWQQHVGQRLRLLNTYGPTEATVVATAHQVQSESESPKPEEAAIIGRPLSNVEVHVLDRYLQPVPPGVPGELFLGGAGLARGYLGRPALTAERFLPNLFSRIPGDRLYRTGDRVRRLPTGDLQFLGRFDSQIKLRGFRIEIGEIEAVLRQHPAVYAATVLLREDLPGDKRLVAYVVSNQAHICTPVDLRAFLQKHLPAYMVPVAFVILDSLPLTLHGKVDRHALPAPSQQTLEGTRIWETPRTPDEELLATIWAQVLHSEQVSRHDQFFEAGGHSLLATQLIARVRDLFGVELPLRTIFETPTLHGLAEAIDRVRRSDQGLLAPPITPHAREAAVPLSYAQQRLWFLDQLQPGNPSYNIALALCLTGPLEIAALHGSLNEMARRHESLRTTFVASEGSPVQTIAPVVHLTLPLLDLSALSPEQQEPVLEWLAQQEAQHPFDLTVSPLIRAYVLRIREDKHVLLLTLHHIITDAWSMGLFIHELALFYTAALQGQPIFMPELPIQYADFAIWQRQWLEGGTGVERTTPFEQQLAYWQTQLAEAPPLLELAADHPRPQIQSFRGAHSGFTLPPVLATALRKLSRQVGATLFMTLLTAFTILLSHYSGQEDIVVGTPIANRTHAELEDVIGFFVNTLALRIDLSGNPILRDLLLRVREVALTAYAHQDLPFERLVEALHLERDLSHTPLFQVMFTLQNTAAAPLHLPDITVTPLSVENGITRFDLTLEMRETGQGLDGVLEYNLDLFEPSTIQRMLGHFQLILESMVGNVEQRLISLPLLSRSEFYQQIVQWNETQAAYPQGRCIHTLFEEQVQQNPDAIALVYEDQQLTYGELNQRANQVAHHLQRRGVGPEGCVGLYVERSLELVVGVLGILKAGGAYLPLDPAYPLERLELMLQETHASVLLTQQRLLHRLPSFAGHTICLDRDWPQLASEHPGNPHSEVSLSNLAYIIYTSGSTGVPKGTPVEHCGLSNLVTAQVQAFAIEPSSRVMQFASISFDAAAAEFFTTLLTGATLVLASRESLLPGPQFIQYLEEQAITVITLPPSVLTALPHAALPTLRTLVAAGEACTAAIVARWSPGRRFLNAYGPSEASVCATIAECVDANHTPPIGYPIANVQTYVLDTQLRPVPIGVTGELYIASVGLARGYLARPALTAERFVPHPFSLEPGARLYKTGDLVRYLSDGQLEYLGRTDSQVKIRGYRIEPGEVEAILAQYPSIAEARVVMREKGAGDKQMVTYIVPHPQQSFTVSDLRRHLQGKLPDYMLPASFVFLETLPLTPNGKLDYHALPAPESNRPVLDKTYVPPRTPVEEVLADIWASVLKLERVGIHDNFFELGGDSILSIQIVVKATNAGLPLTPRHLFQHKTIAELVSVVGALPAVQIEQDLVVGPLLLTPIQHWFFDQQLSMPHHWNQSILLETQQPLNAALLQQAVQALLVHHDMLRLRASHEASGWHLAIAALDDQIPFTYIDLSMLPQAQQITMLEEATRDLQASLNLTSGPILRVASFDPGPQQPGRLLFVIHHLAVDIVSWSILLEDFQTAYQQLRQGHTPLLPSRTTSYCYWSERLSEYAQTPQIRSQLDFWLSQPWQDVRPLPLDASETPGGNTEASTRTITVALSLEETQALLTEVPKVYHTYINEVLVTALMQAFARWTGHTTLLLHLEGHGREDVLDGVDLSRTVGWFTALAPLVLTLAHHSGRGEDLKHIKEQLRRVPQSGISFGLLRYLSQDAAITAHLAALPRPQVSFNYAGRSASALPHEGLFTPAVESVGAIHSPHNQRPHILDINSGIFEGQLYMEWIYSENLHHRSTIEQLASSCLDALQGLIRHCQSPEAGGYTPSDFPEAELDQDALDALIAKLTEAME